MDEAGLPSIAHDARPSHCETINALRRYAIAAH